MPSLEGGIDALRDAMQRGIRPAVIRYYDAEAARRQPVADRRARRSTARPRC